MRCVRQLQFIILCVIALVSIGGCSPIGDIGGGITGRAVDNFWVTPARVAYNVNDVFNREADFSVFLINDKGAVEQIPNKDVEIQIDNAPDNFGTAEPQLIPSTERYAFTSSGRKVIIVNYNDMSAHYSVEVRNPFGLPEDGNGNGNNNGNDGTGIIIEWEVDVTP